jgi:hypothetical protein
MLDTRAIVSEALRPYNDDEEMKYFCWSKYAELAESLMPGSKYMSYFEYLDRYGLK